MKLTKEQLMKVIKEELETSMQEDDYDQYRNSPDNSMPGEDPIIKQLRNYRGNRKEVLADILKLFVSELGQDDVMDIIEMVMK